MGRVTYEQLRRRTAKGYSFNLVPLHERPAIDVTQTLLRGQIATTITEIETGLGVEEKRIAEIYIGKTYIPKRAEEDFNPHEPDTWIMQGISSRYGNHCTKYKIDGMVVLCAITDMTRPAGSRVDHEDFALALEQKLLHHYLLTHPDLRVINNTFDTGRKDKEGYIGYAIYMTFKYEVNADVNTAGAGGPGTTSASGTGTSGTGTSGTGTSGTGTGTSGTGTSGTGTGTSGTGTGTGTSGTSTSASDSGAGASVTAAKGKGKGKGVRKKK